MTRMCLPPNFPGRLRRNPERLQQCPVPDGVHALPERDMAEGHELARRGEIAHRLLLEHRLVAGAVVEDARLQDEVGSVDPAFPVRRLLPEVDNPVPVEVNVATSGRRGPEPHYPPPSRPPTARRTAPTG